MRRSDDKEHAIDHGRKRAAAESNAGQVVERSLIGICKNSMTEVQQFLSYFRASVYKDEAAKTTLSKIAVARSLCEALCIDQVIEPFRDFETETLHPLPPEFPGECSFSARVGRLLGAVERELNSLEKPKPSLNLVRDDERLDQALGSKHACKEL